jgi:hypothetical protein
MTTALREDFRLIGTWSLFGVNNPTLVSTLSGLGVFMFLGPTITEIKDKSHM